MDKRRYLIDGEFGFLQVIQQHASFGYTDIMIRRYKTNTEAEYLKLDRKMIKTYNANLNKNKTYYRKTKGLMNVVFFRLDNLWVLMKSKGECDNENIVEKQFQNLLEERVKIEVGEDFEFELILRNGKFTYIASSESYIKRRDWICDYLKQHKMDKAIYVFNMINGFPSWGGFLEQKKELKKYVVNYAKQLNHYTSEELKAFRKQLRIPINRKIYKNYKD